MNRIIKFRAWHKENKQMEEIDGCNLYIADSEIYEVYEGTWAYQGYMDKTCVTDKYELMQYIAQNDDNNKEIYEGDICETTDEGNGVDEFKDIFYIYWDCEKGGFMICYPYSEEYYNLEEMPNCIVLGNIYENPKLIKESEV